MSVLGTIGIADKGIYNAGTTYTTGNFVLYQGSTWLALKDNLTGIEPEEGENWKYLARGFGSDTLSQILGTDTSGVLGTAGEDVVSQLLIDAIADKVMTKLLPIANLVNNGLTTQAGFALDARYGKTLKDLYDALNSNLSVIGTVSSVSTPSYIQCDSGNSTQIASLSLPAGTYVVTALFGWSTATRGGSRNLEIRAGEYYNSALVANSASDDFNADTDKLYQSASGIITLTATTNIKLWARQKSGSYLSVDSAAKLMAVRIK